jgi:peptidoglycan/LPS O-acetylase OafA/YrhL
LAGWDGFQAQKIPLRNIEQISSGGKFFGQGQPAGNLSDGRTTRKSPTSAPRFHILALRHIFAPYTTVTNGGSEFISGAVAGILIRRSHIGFAAPALIAGISLLVVVLSFRDMAADFITDRSWTRVILVGVPCALIVYGMAAQERRGALRAPNWLAALGDASYSTYLSHVLVLSALGRLFALVPRHNFITELAFVLGGIALANMIGLLSCRLIERRRYAVRPAVDGASATQRTPLHGAHLSTGNGS